MPKLSPHKLETMHEEHVSTIDHIALLAQAIRAPRSARHASIPRFQALLRALVSDFEEDIEGHFRFEELHLFTVLRKAGHPELADSLTLEHAALRDARRQLLTHVHDALTQDLSEGEWELVGQLTTKLIDRQRAHMNREESEMTPVLRAVMCAGAQNG